MLRNFILIISATFFLAGSALAQDVAPPGSIKLLPGYHNQPTYGIDSKTGIISKEGGVEIHYDIGDMAGDYTDCLTCGWTKGEVWRRKQLVNGQKAVFVFTNKKRLVISFPSSHANFYATIHTSEQLTDTLLMLLTFQPSSALRN